jgi:phosphoserine phosphatase RsbU/P
MDPSTAQPASPHVLIYVGPHGPLTVALDRDTTCVGRLPDQDLVLRENYVSRRHAVINRIDGAFELVDQQSTHGTYLNGARVSRAALHAGDVLQFGSPRGLRVRFQLASSSASSLFTKELLTAISHFSSKHQGERPAARELEQLNFLLAASRRLNSGDGLSDILGALLQLSIQFTAVERGFIFLFEHGRLSLALGRLADGSPVFEDSTVSRRAIDTAIQSALPFYVSDTQAALEAAPWDSVREHSIRSICCIPLRKRISAEQASLLGLLYLDSKAVPGRLNSIDHELLGMIAAEASTLLENVSLAEAEARARLAAEELAIAASIHTGLMSFALPTLPYARLAARTIPCREIGGDFYDAIALPDGLGIVVADVSGKGVPASIVAATLQGIIHAQMLTGRTLAEIAALVNRFLCARSVGKYATMVLLKLQSNGRVEYLNCGQNPPLLVSPAGVRPLEESSMMVGLLPEANYTPGVARLSPGARILVATDGLTEAENSLEEQFGSARFETAALQENLDAILNRMTEFQSGQPALDDCPLLEVEYLG